MCEITNNPLSDGNKSIQELEDMTAAPATKFNDIVERLLSLDTSGDLSSNIVVFSAKKLADQLMAKEPDMAYTLLGITSCIEGNLEDMRKFHKNAIKLSGGSAMAYYQYSISLARRYCLAEALEYAGKAIDLDQACLAYLDTAIPIALSAKDTGKFNEYTDRWLKLKKEHHPLHLAGMSEEEYLDIVYNDPELNDALEYLSVN